MTSILGDYIFGVLAILSLIVSTSALFMTLQNRRLLQVTPGSPKKMERQNEVEPRLRNKEGVRSQLGFPPEAEGNEHIPSSEVSIISSINEQASNDVASVDERIKVLQKQVLEALERLERIEIDT